MSKAWGIGAWAAESERAEAEEKFQAAAVAAAAGESFPSLKEAVSTSKTKKKTKMSLQEFTMGSSGSRRDYSQGLTPEEMRRLPTGPKERPAEEMQYGRLGGGFSNYGRTGGGPPGRMRDRDGDGDSSWNNNRRSYGGFDDDNRRGGPPPRVSDYDAPSRADEVDNWASAKKPMMQSFDSGRTNSYNSLGGGGGGGGFSRADEIDNWAVNKKPVPVQPRSSTFGTFGSGFRDSGPEPDGWARGVDQERQTERRRLVLDPPRGESGPIEPVVKTNKPSPFGAARPREEILAEKDLERKKVDLETETKKTTSSRPGSSHSNSRPGSAQSGRSEGAAAALQGLEKPKPKVNPFGDAKPREVLLQEKGVDYRKIDLELEHRRLGRPETEEEKNLREEIDHLKKEFEKESASNANKESLQGSTENQTTLPDQILQKERELELLIHDLDDKVRFGQKAIERPGSGAGRIAARFQERPPSQSGSFEESRSVDFTERPRSRGTGDAWMRHGDDRRAFPGARERGFLGNRDFGRSSSRERW